MERSVRRGPLQPDLPQPWTRALPEGRAKLSAGDKFSSALLTALGLGPVYACETEICHEVNIYFWLKNY